MKSMTGFGMGEYVTENESITVEAKSVNHRYKDYNFRFASRLSALENNARNLVSKMMSRGHIDMIARYSRYADTGVKLHYDDVLAKDYMRILERIREDLPGASGEISVMDVARFPNVVVAESGSEDLDELWEKFSSAITSAMEMLNSAREAEGENLKKDMLSRISFIEEKVEKIAVLTEDLPKEFYETLKKNAAEYTESPLDEDRLYTELAIYADRVNITEELVRLRSHIGLYRKTCELTEPVGRKLDFTLQEINREVNTIASKSNSAEISQIVIDIKAELEKIREQVQNIE